MSDNKKIYYILVPVAAILLVYIVLNFNLFDMVPFNGQVNFEMVSTAIENTDGGFILIDKSQKRIIETNKDGKVEYSLFSNKDITKSFSYAKEIAEGGGSVYVLDNILDENSFYVITQRILKFTDGKLSAVVYEHVYENERPAVEGNVLSIKYMNDKIYFILKEKDSFSLCSVTDGNSEIITKYFFESSNSMLRDFDYNEQNIFGVTKRGDIYKFSSNGSELIYHAIDYKVEYGEDYIYSLPWEVSVSENGEVFCTDIGRREILKIDNLYNSSPVNGIDLDEQELFEYPIYYRFTLSEKNDIITSNENSVVIINDKTTEIDSASLKLYDRVKLILLIIAMLGFLVICIVLVKKPIKYVLDVIKNSRNSKLGLGVFGIISITAALVSAMIIGNMGSRYEEEILNRMSAIATLTANNLDKDALSKIKTPEDYAGEAFFKIREDISKSINHDYYWNSGLYADIYKVKNSIIYTCINMEDTVGTYYPQNWEFEDSDESKILKNGDAFRYKDLNTAEGSYIFAYNPVFDGGEVVAIIEVGVNMDGYNRQNREMIKSIILNTVTLVVVIMLIITELLVFAETLKKRKKKKSEGEKYISGGLMRPVVFIVFFASNMAASFMPNYANILYHPILFIPKEIVIALPMSAEVLTCAIFSFFGGYIAERFGIKKTFVFGFIMFFIGLILCGIAPDVLYLIIANAVSGIGSGLALVSANSYIASIEDENLREEGFSSYNSAFLSGINTAVVIGASLVSFIGYKNVFYAAAFVAFLGFVYIYRCIDNTHIHVEKNGETRINTLQFLLKPKVIGFLVLTIIPYVAFGYFLHYFFPLFGEKNGLSEIAIGQAFLLNGIWIIYLGPITSKAIIGKIGKHGAIVAATLMYGAAFIAFGLNPTLNMALLVLVIMGISDSFGYTAQTVYYSSLGEVDDFGVKKSMGVYSLFENIAQVMGPIVFSIVMIMGISFGITVLAAVLFASAILSVLTSVGGKGHRTIVKGSDAIGK